jgi:hypothetical protein
MSLEVDTGALPETGPDRIRLVQPADPDRANLET